MDPNTPLTALPGIGPKTAERYAHLEIETVGDLLNHFPVRYFDLRYPKLLSQAVEGEEVLLAAQVVSAPLWVSRKGRFSMFTQRVQDESGVLAIHRFNQPYLFHQLKQGDQYYFYGKIKRFQGKLQMDNPQVFPYGDAPGMLAAYSLTQGLSQKKLREAVAAALAGCQIEETLSDGCRRRFGLPALEEAFYWIHRPQSPSQAEAGQKSCRFRELLVFNRCIEMLEHREQEAPSLAVGREAIDEFTAKLPFSCTGAQLEAMEEIREDLAKPQAMNRLLQGDVGSGKTVVALFAAYVAAKQGAQTAFMARTELLATQHYKNTRAIFGNRTALLTGSTPAAERKAILEGIAEGSIQVLVGTHALLYGDLPFQNLALAITDEQHRFGVAQRSKLAKGGGGMHTLILSATPIPRTLSLVLYAKTEVSRIQELPPGRKPIKTYLVDERKRSEMYGWIEDRVKCGEQAYVVCPLVEPSELFSVRSVEEVTAELKARFKTIAVAALHGKMPPKQKTEIMEAFRQGKVQVLVATTVIEVGVDVPQATVMAIENADRFGLAQLHQLRGRVGRGEGESSCFLVSDGSALERLKILKETTDGFLIAEKDLELRGMGELLGERQHGKDGLVVSNLARDAELLLAARDALGEMQKSFPEDYAAVTSQARAKLEAGQFPVILN